MADDLLRKLARSVDDGLKTFDDFSNRPEVKKAVGDMVDFAIDGTGKAVQGGIELARKYDGSPAMREETPRSRGSSGATSRSPDAPVVVNSPVAGDWPKIGGANRAYAPAQDARSRRQVASKAQEPVRVSEERIVQASRYAEGALVTELPGQPGPDVQPFDKRRAPAPLDESAQNELDYERALQEEVDEIREESLRAEIEKREIADLFQQLKEAEQRLNALLAEQAKNEADERARRATQGTATPAKEKKEPPKKTPIVEKKAAPATPPPEKIKKDVEATQRHLEDLKQKEQKQKARAAEAAKARRLSPAPIAPRVTMPAEPLLLKQSDRVAISIVKNLLAYEGVPKPIPDKHFTQRQIHEAKLKLERKDINLDEFNAEVKRLKAEEAQSTVAADRRRRFKSREEIQTAWATAIVTAAREAGVDPLLILAVMKKESGFREWAVSVTNARGLLQLFPGAVTDVNAKYPDKVKLEDVRNDPTANLKTGIRYLGFLNERFKHDLELQLMAYNVGPTALQAFLNANGIGLGNEASFKNAPKGLRPLREVPAESLYQLIVAIHQRPRESKIHKPRKESELHKALRKSKLKYADKIAHDWIEFTKQSQQALSFVAKA